MTGRRRGRLLLCAAVAAGLAGCQSLGPRKIAPPPPPRVATPAPTPTVPPPRVVILPAPPPKSCVPRTLAGPPRYPDTDAALRAAPGAADRYQLMAAGRILRQQRLEELERAISACR